MLRLQMLIDIAFKMATGQVEALRPMGLRLLKVGCINAFLHRTHSGALCGCTSGLPASMHSQAAPRQATTVFPKPGCKASCYL